MCVCVRVCVHVCVCAHMHICKGDRERVRENIYVRINQILQTTLVAERWLLHCRQVAASCRQVAASLQTGGCFLHRGIEECTISNFGQRQQVQL